DVVRSSFSFESRRICWSVSMTTIAFPANHPGCPPLASKSVTTWSAIYTAPRATPPVLDAARLSCSGSQRQRWRPGPSVLPAG
ncbi:hypothetical protein, partial [Mesorhizobium sp.]|uniref:hypothetical protein n=1 Tax=Mesorhizobium sp. TaxID=1871066 RepID=UPI0025C0767E